MVMAFARRCQCSANELGGVGTAVGPVDGAVVGEEPVLGAVESVALGDWCMCMLRCAENPQAIVLYLND